MRSIYLKTQSLLSGLPTLTRQIHDVVLESMPAAEIAAPDSPFIEPANPYFDITLTKYISAYITEFGIETT